MNKIIRFFLLSITATSLTATAFAQIKAEGNARQVIPINSDWDFKKTGKAADSATVKYTSEKVNLPHTWNNHDMQLGKNFYEGEGQYKKELFVDASLKDKRVFIRFEGVGQVAEVLVNNKSVGKHEGGYSAFCFDISYALQYGKSNTITVKVNNTASKTIIPINHSLFGVYGGIYRPVSLLVTNKVHITTTDFASPGIYISQKEVSQNQAKINIAVKLENKNEQPLNIQVKNTIYDRKGNEVQSKLTPIMLSPQGITTITQQIQLEKPHLWQGLTDPYLYKVVAQVMQDNKVIDEVVQPLGVRNFNIIPGKGFFLNQQPYPLHGVCRHQDWWESGSALSNQQHKADIDMIKEIGATSIRFAHYQQAEYMYSQCDTTGFVIWAEVPFVNAVSGMEADNAKQQLRELIRQNYNHPSIYVWGLHNEVYCKTPGDYTAVLTKELNDVAKTEDPDRYTVSVSGYGEMDRPANLNADIQGMNRYFGWYEGKIGDMEQWVKGLETKYPNHKLILSEYGAEGNTNQQIEGSELKDTYNYNSQFYPEGYETKTHEAHWAIIANHPYITASYVWNMFDFAVPMWARGGVPARNMKGLVTFDRKLKKDAFYWYKANWSKEPVVYITERRLVSRKNAITPVTVYSNQGSPELFVNGKKLAAPTQGTTSVHYIFNNVQLKKGKNKIKTVVTKDGKPMVDQIEWILL